MIWFTCSLPFGIRIVAARGSVVHRCGGGAACRFWWALSAAALVEVVSAAAASRLGRTFVARPLSAAVASGEQLPL